jgi:dipeptidyl aminopeptidase/acylaminoacyl peptidase
MAGYFILNIALAGIFVYILTHPTCHHYPQPPEGLFQPEEHWLQTEDGLSIKVWYYPTQNGAAILALGGMSGSLGIKLPPVDFLVHEGYGVLQIDSRACARPQATVTLGGDEVYDATAALTFLRTLPEVDKIGAFGFSMGGATVIRTAVQHPEIEAVVAEGNYANLGELLTDADQPLSWSRRLFSTSITTSYLLFSRINPWSISPIEALPHISPRPVFLIFGEHESKGGRAQAQFTRAGDPKTIWIVPQGEHGRNHLIAREEYEKRVIAFFKATLFGD